MISEGSHVDFVLEDFEELDSEYDSGAHFDAARSRAVWIDYESGSRYESHAAHGSMFDDDIEDLDTLPEPRLDDDITLVRARPVEHTWWEAAKRGLRAISTPGEQTWWEAARRGLRSRP